MATNTTGTRQEKGRLLARDRRIKNVSGSTWTVPSQTSNSGAYMVNVMAATCSCPDYELRRTKCKHLRAVEIVNTIETAPDDTQVVTESVKVTRKTYTHDWPACNAAHCADKETMTMRVAKFAGVPDGDILTGKFPPVGTCPKCGHTR